MAELECSLWIVLFQIFDDITDDMAEQFEDDFERMGVEDMGSDDESQSGSDSDEIDIFDSVVDREARRILFDLLHITYHFIRRYKADQFNVIIDSVAAKFEVM